ncbi:MAG: hypothetical protein AAGA85_19005 [Bacteroidota bacterium]
MEEESGKEKKWAISLATINSHVPAVTDSRSRIIIPAWGLGVDYKVSEKWALVFLTELEIQSYVVEQGEEQELEREFPLITVLAVGYEITPNIVVDVGIGREFESNESFNLLHFAAAYNFHLPNHWHIGPGAALNLRENGFPTYSFKIGAAKMF